MKRFRRAWTLNRGAPFHSPQRLLFRTKLKRLWPVGQRRFRKETKDCGKRVWPRRRAGFQPRLHSDN